ncbi:hybrid sensor histidine kinase/response regulator [Pseudoalteromonas sp. CO302Y]|uniref:ATP-binding protein n=1 Tax=unclassified Pseudoalteromonas TaxID=194690 RepID=UPI001022EF74|nr:hybrid sensor histidine kinase/response regulator [Pseudoalteromonas sp. CO302Y]RZG09283.1 hybrid sensor histidine kinase/response regulator [Pseudoalteromonas sp. CO133X]
MKNPRFSRALFFSVLLLVITPLLILAALMIGRFYLNSIEQANTSLQWQARNNAASLEQLFFKLEKNSQVLSNTKAIAELPDKVVYSQFALMQLQEFVNTNPQISAAIVIDNQGFIVEGYPITSLTLNYSLTKQILENSQILDNQNTIQVLDNEHLNELFTQQDTKHSALLAITSTLLNEQDSLSEPIKKTGVLVSFIPLSEAVKWLAKHNEQPLYQTGKQVQLKVKEQVLYSLGDALDKAQLSSEATINRVIFDNALSPLLFKINETESAYTTAVKQTAVMAAGLIITLFIISFLLVRWLTLRLHNPLNRIAAISREFALGNYKQVKNNFHYQEFKDIADSLNSMAETIDIQITSLQLEKIRAEHSEQVKSQFLANMSHEIRTPMNGIVGFLQLLNKSELSQEQTDFVRQINNCSDVLLTVINDILDFSKIEANKIELEHRQCDLVALCNDLILLFKPSCDAKGIVCRLDVDKLEILTVECDEIRVKQVLINLLSNAVKFTKQGEITLSLNVVHQSNEKTRIEFAVKDTGIGIAEDKINALFNPFVQAQSNITREYGGTGLGLAISKGLIDLMEGEININSELGKGTIFTIQVDFETVLEDLNIQQAEQTADRSRNDFSVVEKPLLIAEDNPINQIVITKYLAQLGLKYELADNGQVACEKASNKEYALILMDIQMPVMDGLTASKILLNKKGFNTPIIAVSANAMKEDINKSIAMGISDHIAKPINFEELELALAKWLFQQN